jgi:hypothetical protein
MNIKYLKEKTNTMRIHNTFSHGIQKYNNNNYYYYFVISIIKYEMEVALSYQMVVYTCYKPRE